MMKHFNLLFAMLFMGLFAKAQTIDFENLGLQEGDAVTNQFCIGECCVTFYLGEKVSPGVYNIVGQPILAKVGSPVAAFTGSLNTACNANTIEDMKSLTLPPSIIGPGCYFLTNDRFRDASTIKALIIEFASSTTMTSGQILDIDGTEEIWELTAFQNNGGIYTTVASQTLSPVDNLGGDGGTTPFAFNTPTPFDRIVIEYKGTKLYNIGLAFDNFSICSITAPCNADFTYTFNIAYNYFSFRANNPAGGNSYTWDFGDGTPQVNGAQVTHAYTQPGTYQVCLFVEGEDGECEKCFSICVTEEQIEEGRKSVPQSKPGLSSDMDIIEGLYPNPAKEQITLELNPKQAGMAKLVIYDMSGRKIISNTFSLQEGFQEIIQYIPGISQGIYFCEIKMNGKYRTMKFLVE